MSQVIIDGITYEQIADADSHPLRIVVLDRGFVVVGRVELHFSYLIIRECQCIRKWGTTKGLGQLASEGPTDNTVLDPQPTTRVHELQVVQQIDCEVDKWIL